MILLDITLPLSQLLLDPNNYRIDYESNDRQYSEEEIIGEQNRVQSLLEKERLGELRDSIRENGFLEMDRIVVRKLGIETTPSLFVVVEGNRRTAAFKDLMERYKAGEVSLDAELVEKSKSINVLLIDEPIEKVHEIAANIMGIRHVSGPKKWSGFQSARLIDERIQSGKKLSTLAPLLGISAIEAGRRLRGYRAFKQMRKDPVYGTYIKPKHYTLLLEFLASKSVGREWLDWDDEQYRFRSKRNLDKLYSYITEAGDPIDAINNPNDAREFLRLLGFSPYRKRIDAGESWRKLPSLESDGEPVDEGWRIKQLNKFHELLLNNWEAGKSSEEAKLLREIVDLGDQILGASDD